MNLIITAAVTVGLALLKGSASLIGFLLKIITTIIRLLLCVLPITGGCILVTSGYFIFCRVAGGEQLPETFFYRPDPAYFLKSLDILTKMMNDLTASVPEVVTVILWIAAIILAIPVLSVLLLTHAAISLFRALIFLVPADVLLLILLSLLRGQTPFAMLRERFLILFPKVALHRDERSYHDWLRRHGDEFREDTYGRPRGRREAEADDMDPRDDGRFRYEAGDDPEMYRSHDPYGSPAGRGSRANRSNRRAIRQERRRRQIEAYYEDEGYGESYDEDPYGRDAYDEDPYADDPYGEDPYDDAYDDHPYDAYDTYDDAYDDYGNSYEYDDDHEKDRRSHAGRRRADTYNVHDEEESHGRDRDSRRSTAGSTGGAAGTSFDFFAGCRDLQSVEKKYRSLAKIYHPDNQDGDTAAIQEINRQYAEARRRMR